VALRSKNPSPSESAAGVVIGDAVRLPDDGRERVELVERELPESTELNHGPKVRRPGSEGTMAAGFTARAADLHHF